jgi:perosamine synthetase
MSVPGKKEKLPLSVTHPGLAKQADGWDPSSVTAGSNKKFYFLTKNESLKKNFNIKNYFRKSIKYIPVLDENKKLNFIFFKDNSISTPLVKPHFSGNENKYLNDCIKTNWISSKGKYVTRFEKKFK